MSAPLGKGEGAPGAGRRPTEQQLQMARVRARATGESVAYVLSVFMGGGRYGPGDEPEVTGPEAALTSGRAAEDLPDGTGPERLATVLPFSRATVPPAESAGPADPGDGADDEAASRRPDQED